MYEKYTDGITTELFINKTLNKINHHLSEKKYNTINKNIILIRILIHNIKNIQYILQYIKYNTSYEIKI